MLSSHSFKSLFDSIDWLGRHHMRTSKPPEINKQATLLETSSHRLGRHSQLMHVTYKITWSTTNNQNYGYPTSNIQGVDATDWSMMRGGIPRPPWPTSNHLLANLQHWWPHQKGQLLKSGWDHWSPIFFQKQLVHLPKSDVSIINASLIFLLYILHSNIQHDNTIFTYSRTHFDLVSLTPRSEASL